MPTPAIILIVLFFPLLIAANVILLWAFGRIQKAGLWPTERFFGFEVRCKFQIFSVMKRVRQRIRETDDPAEAKQLRRYLHAVYWGYGLGLVAAGVLVAFLPWLVSLIPKA